MSVCIGKMRHRGSTPDQKTDTISVVGHSHSVLLHVIPTLWLQLATKKAAFV